MLTEYKGVRVERQNGLLKHVCRAHYDFKRRVILLRDGLRPDEEAAVLEHEIEHFAFGERHRWLSRLALNDNVFLMSALCSLVWKTPAFMLLAVPFLTHEIQVERKTTRNRIAMVIYAVLLFVIFSSVFAVVSLR